MDFKTRKEKLIARLDALKLFPNNNEIRILRRRTQRQLENLERNQKEPLPIVTKIPKKKSSSLKKYHRYIRLIRDNFPDLKYSDIRKEFAKRKRGKPSKISDVVWQNPSP